MLSEEQSAVVALVHGRNHGEEFFYVVGIEMAGRDTIIRKPNLPSLACLMQTHVVLEPDDQLLGL